MEWISPRINGKLVGQYAAQRPNVPIRLVGEVVQHVGHEVTLNAPDNVRVRVLNVDPDTIQGKYLEVTGIVNPDGTIECQTSTFFGDNFDMALYNDAVIMSNKLREVFPDSEGHL
eukprot:Colp12_sorted_trinity150504_noHs@17977